MANWFRSLGLLGSFSGAALLFAGLIAAPAAAQSIPKEFVGSFRGSLIGSAGEIEGDFTLVSSASREGFELEWTSDVSATFNVSDRKNVFRARDRGRLLEGAPTFWARMEAGNLLVYSMRIDEHGGYDIRTYIYEPVENGLNLTIRHLRAGSEPLVANARLDRYGR